MEKPVIQINHLGNVNWNNLPSNFTINHSNDVWRIRVSSHLQFIDDLWLILSPAEQERANGYHRELPKQTLVISHGYLRLLLAKYTGVPPAEIGFEIGKNGKPNIKSIANSALHYNISHSGDYILIAIADTEIGVDVEKWDKSVHFGEIMDMWFSNAEIAYVEASKNPANSFYRLWTRKEALVKATAKGIDDDLNLIPCLDGIHAIDQTIIGSNTGWLTSSFDFDENYTGCISSITAKINFYEVI